LAKFTWARLDDTFLTQVQPLGPRNPFPGPSLGPVMYPSTDIVIPARTFVIGTPFVDCSESRFLWDGTAGTLAKQLALLHVGRQRCRMIELATRLLAAPQLCEQIASHAR
jgi:hypothetical protein